MRLSADSYFCIGSAHVTAGMPAQDYAMAGFSRDTAIAVVSDGCSTGGRTDVGARLVALSTMKAVCVAPTLQAITVNQSHFLFQAQDNLGLNGSDLLATCLFISAGPENAFYRLQGDGVAAVKYLDQSIWMQRYDWMENTPFYPAYSDMDQQRFIEVHGGDHSGHRLSVLDIIAKPDGSQITWKSSRQLSEGMHGIEYPYPNLSNISCLAVFSDGVTQIDGVDWKDAVVDLMSFKNTTGEFVKRRSMAAIRKWREIGKGPMDDFSMAAIHVNHE